MTFPSTVKKFLWDVDPAALNPVKHRAFIITRLADRGDWPAVRWLKKQYGAPLIKRVVAKSQNASAKTKNFWRLF